MKDCSSAAHDSTNTLASRLVDVIEQIKEATQVKTLRLTSGAPWSCILIHDPGLGIVKVDMRRFQRGCVPKTPAVDPDEDGLVSMTSEVVPVETSELRVQAVVSATGELITVGVSDLAEAHKTAAADGKLADAFASSSMGELAAAVGVAVHAPEGDLHGSPTERNGCSGSCHDCQRGGPLTDTNAQVDYELNAKEMEANRDAFWASWGRADTKLGKRFLESYFGENTDTETIQRSEWAIICLRFPELRDFIAATYERFASQDEEVREKWVHEFLRKVELVRYFDDAGRERSFADGAVLGSEPLSNTERELDGHDEYDERLKIDRLSQVMFGSLNFDPSELTDEEAEVLQKRFPRLSMPAPVGVSATSSLAWVLGESDVYPVFSWKGALTPLVARKLNPTDVIVELTHASEPLPELDIPIFGKRIRESHWTTRKSAPNASTLPPFELIGALYGGKSNLPASEMTPSNDKDASRWIVDFLHNFNESARERSDHTQTLPYFERAVKAANEGESRMRVFFTFEPAPLGGPNGPSKPLRLSVRLVENLVNGCPGGRDPILPSCPIPPLVGHVHVEEQRGVLRVDPAAHGCKLLTDHRPLRSNELARARIVAHVRGELLRHYDHHVLRNGHVPVGAEARLEVDRALELSVGDHLFALLCVQHVHILWGSCVQDFRTHRTSVRVSSVLELQPVSRVGEQVGCRGVLTWLPLRLSGGRDLYTCLSLGLHLSGAGALLSGRDCRCTLRRDNLHARSGC